jgi:hypothetical protein
MDASPNPRAKRRPLCQTACRTIRRAGRTEERCVFRNGIRNGSRWWVLLLLICLLAAPVVAAAGGSDLEKENRVHAYLYKDDAFNKPLVVFSPYDKIVLSVKFLRLPAGNYRFEADWYNAFGELQEESRFSFSLQALGDYALESWLRMRQAGIMRRLTSVSETSGFHVKFYGTWRVAIFLNGEKVTERTFQVQ